MSRAPVLVPGKQIGPTRIERSPLNKRQKMIWDVIAAAPPGQIVIVGYGGAAGGGKTRGLVELAEDFALDNPGTKILIGRKDFKDLRTTTMEQFDMHVPAPLIWKRNNQEHWREIRDASWPPGISSKVLFRELKDWMGLGSEEYGMVLIDEAGEVPQNAARMLLSRLRWQLPEIVMKTQKTADTPWGRVTPEYPEGKPVRYPFVAASNPYPGWFKEWFWENQLMKEEGMAELFAGGVHFIRALPSDNPKLPPNYEANLRAIWPEDWVRRLMEGRWDAFEGQVFPELSPKVHLWPGGLKNLPDPKEWKRVIGGLDFGGNNPNAHFSAGIVAIELRSNRIIRVGMFEENGARVMERQLQWMIDMQQHFCSKAPHIPPKIKWVADKSQFRAIDMWRHMGFNIIPSKGGWDSVEVGIAHQKQRMQTDAAGIPGSFYVAEIEKFADRMMSYRYEEPSSDTVSVKRRPIDRFADICDADRYMHELLERPFGGPASGQIAYPQLASVSPPNSLASTDVPDLLGPMILSKLGVNPAPWKAAEPSTAMDRFSKESFFN